MLVFAICALLPYLIIFIIPFPSAAMSFCKYKLRLNIIITEFFGDFSPIFALNVSKCSIKSLLVPVFTFQFVQCVSIIMLQKSSARKGFCAEGLRIWRVKWSIQHAGSTVFSGLSAWVIFLLFFFFVPKIVPKVIGCIIIFIQSMNFLQTLFLAVLTVGVIA